LVHNHGVGLVQVLNLAEQHLPRGADQGAVVQADQNDAAKVAASVAVVSVGQSGPDAPTVHLHRPGHSFDPADPVQIVVGQADDLVHLANTWVHHPNLALLNVSHQVGRAGHD